ncbi:hypothetical protein CTheo_3315 [Ceratobasidium theobromae]|uniref:Uncharacterized protein n=1 Tax=Ceratobasidium theobromae TaxID=1582974 RepID=A0A5N5QNU1_9AGAM|nr:hypothetical protein CTheo_3315 [Ceratobasidium theobromae]
MLSYPKIPLAACAGDTGSTRIEIGRIPADEFHNEFVMIICVCGAKIAGGGDKSRGDHAQFDVTHRKWIDKRMAEFPGVLEMISGVIRAARREE